MIKEEYIFSDYELEVAPNNDFTLIYNYYTPVTLECFHAGWQPANAIHKVIENYSNDKKLVNRECKIDVENIRKCKYPIIDGYTNFSEKELLEQFNQEKDEKKFIDISINNNDIYNKHYLTDGYIIEIFCGISLFFNKFDMLTGIDFNNPFNISNISFFINDIKVNIRDEKGIVEILYGNKKYSVSSNKIIDNTFKNKIKCYPHRNVDEYTIEFLEDGYYICPKKGEKELYSYTGIRIDKYPLIQKNSPDFSYGTITKFLNKELGSFECTNLLGQTIGGQLNNGTTYLYLYHRNGSYIISYSNGHNRFYNRSGEWNKTVSVEMQLNGNHKLTFKDGTTKTYNLAGEKINKKNISICSKFLEWFHIPK